MTVEKLSNNAAAGEEFSEFLKQKVKAENLLLDNVYNVDEIGIY